MILYLVVLLNLQESKQHIIHQMDFIYKYQNYTYNGNKVGLNLIINNNQPIKFNFSKKSIENIEKAAIFILYS